MEAGIRVFAPNGIITTEPCPVCQNPEQTVKHGIAEITNGDGTYREIGLQHYCDCPECGPSWPIVCYDCPDCLQLDQIPF